MQWSAQRRDVLRKPCNVIHSEWRNITSLHPHVSVIIVGHHFHFEATRHKYLQYNGNIAAIPWWIGHVKMLADIYRSVYKFSISQKEMVLGQFTCYRRKRFSVKKPTASALLGKPRRTSSWIHSSRHVRTAWADALATFNRMCSIIHPYITFPQILVLFKSRELRSMIYLIYIQYVWQCVNACSFEWLLLRQVRGIYNMSLTLLK